MDPELVEPEVAQLDSTPAATEAETSLPEAEQQTTTAHAHAPSLHIQTPPLDPRILANVVTDYEGETLVVPHCDVPVYHGVGRLAFRTGFVYSGDFYLGRMHGRGRIEWTSGVVYDGDFIDNEMRGRGSYTWPNGSSYTGDVVAGKRHGRGVFITGHAGVPTRAAIQDAADGGPLNGAMSPEPPVLFTYHEREVASLACTDSERVNDSDFDCNDAAAAVAHGQSNARYDGEWCNGLPHGDGVLIYDDANTVRYEGQFVHGKREGRGQMRYASGNLYVGHWIADAKCGYGVMRWMGPPLASSSTSSTTHNERLVLHELYEGAWRDDCQHGFGRHVWLHTRQREKNYYEGEFRCGLRHGLGAFYYANGARYEGAWQANSKHGTGAFFYDDGRVFHGAFRHDRCVEPTAAHAMETAGVASTSTITSASTSNSSNSTAAARILLYIDALLPEATTSGLSRAASSSSDAARDKAKRAVEHAALRLNTELRALYRSAMTGSSSGETALLLETFEVRKLLADCGVHVTSGHVEQLICAIRAAQHQSVQTTLVAAAARDTDMATASPHNSDNSDSDDPTLSFTERLQRRNTLPSPSVAGIVPHDALLLYREFVELLVRLAHCRRLEQFGDDVSQSALADAFAALYDQMLRGRIDAQQQQAATSWLSDLRRQLLAKELQLIAAKHSAQLHRLFCESADAHGSVGSRDAWSRGDNSSGVDSGHDASSASNDCAGDVAVSHTPASVSVRALLSLLRHVDASGSHAQVFGADFRLRDALAALEHVFAGSLSVQQHQQVGRASDENDSIDADGCDPQQLKYAAEPAVDPFFADTLLVYSEFVDALAVVLFAKQHKTNAQLSQTARESDASQQQQQPLALHVLLDLFLQSVRADSQLAAQTLARDDKRTDSHRIAAAPPFASIPRRVVHSVIRGVRTHVQRPALDPRECTTLAPFVQRRSPSTPSSASSAGFLRGQPPVAVAITTGGTSRKKRKREPSLPRSASSFTTAPLSPPPSPKTLHIGVDMPLREPPAPAPPLTLSFATASAAAAAPLSPGATILDQCLQLPKLNLGSCSARSSATRAKFLAPIAPLQPPFTARPAWCLALETYTKPRAVVLLDVYKDHEFLTTHTVYQKSAYLIGRNTGICDIVLSHCSISRLHAILLHHEDGASVYLVDLGSAHGTFVDTERLKPLQPTLLLHGAQIKFGASSRSYTFKTFDSREQIAALVRAQVGLDADERALNHNTLLNRAVSYRLELSPSLLPSWPDDPMAFGELLPNQNQNQNCPPAMPLEHVAHERRSSTDDLTLSLAAFQHDEPARKRSRGQSGTSQGSSDTSMAGGDGMNQTMASAFDDDVDLDDPHAEPKRVHFSTQAPVEIPPASPLLPADNSDATDGDDGSAATRSTESSAASPEAAALWAGETRNSSNSSGRETTRAPSQSSERLALRLGGLTALTIPTQDARS